MSQPNKLTITAIPCGRDRSGEPITQRRTFRLVRDPEPFGDRDGRAQSRLWGEMPRSRAPFAHTIKHIQVVPLAVVWTDTIEQVAA